MYCALNQRKKKTIGQNNNNQLFWIIDKRNLRVFILSNRAIIVKKFLFFLVLLTISTLLYTGASLYLHTVSIAQGRARASLYGFWYICAKPCSHTHTHEQRANPHSGGGGGQCVRDAPHTTIQYIVVIVKRTIARQ